MIILSSLANSRVTETVSPRASAARGARRADTAWDTGTGAGRALIGSLLNTLEAEGVTRVYLEVRAANAAAIALYTSVGFRPLRTLEGYYTDADGTETDGLRMLRIAGATD